MNLRLPHLGMLATVGLLAGCFGDDRAPATYTITGTVSGLTGSGLVLSNGGTAVPVTSAGSFSLPGPLTVGDAYTITVATQPSSPAQLCTVANGSGVANANVTNIAVTCANVTYTVSGSVSGLTGSGLVLSNGGVNLPVTVAGNFTLAAPLNAGTAYSLTVAAQPSAPAQVCTVVNGSGVANAVVSNIAVNCVTTPITISSSTPAAGALSVARDVAPALTFTAPINNATVPGNVTFKRGANAVAAGFSTSGSTVTVTPQVPLSLLTTYTVAAQAGLLGTYAEPVAASSGISFTTRDGVWHPQEIAKVNAPNTSAVKIAMTSDRNAIAVWQQQDGPHRNVWANTYVVGSGWGTAQQLQTQNASDESDPEIAADGHGHAYVVWTQSDGTRSDVWYNRYTVGSGWGSATQLSSLNQGIENAAPAVAVNAAGDAVFAWVNNTNQDYSVWASYMPASAAPGTAVRIESAIGSTGDVKVVMDSAGNATALWVNFDNANNTGDLWANRCIAGTWQAGSIIENSLQSVSEYAVAAASANEVIAVWTQQISNSSQGVYTSRYHIGLGWSAAATLATTTDSSAYYPQVAADGDGNAMIIWGQYDSSVFQSYSRYYTAGVSWASAVPMGATNVPDIALDASGNALAVWYAEVSQSSRAIKASRYTVANGWGSTATLTPSATAYAQYSKFAIDEFGNAMAVWVDYNLQNNTSDIASSRFDDTPVVQ
jgi:hypothetical protein